MSEPSGDCPHVRSISDQKCCSGMPQAVQRDQGQLWCVWLAGSIIIPDDPVECLIWRIKPHALTVPLSEDAVSGMPLATDSEPPLCLLTFPLASQSNDRSRNRDVSQGSFCFCCLYDCFTARPVNTLVCAGKNLFLKLGRKRLHFAGDGSL